MSTAPTPVSILGTGLRLPGGIGTLDALWQHLLTGDELVRDGARGTERAGYLDGIEAFDAAPFGISATEALQMDPQQRLLLETTWDALTDAGIAWDELRGQDVGVFVGAYSNDWLTLQTRRGGEFDAYSGAGASHAILANRISYLLDVHGPSIAVDTACSSSLVALHLACQSLRLGECDTAVVGGVALGFDPAYRAMTRASLPFSATGSCRPFDAAADGIVRGEGVVTLVLQRADTVAAQGRRARGTIRGSAVNHDGRTNGLTAPNPRAQAHLLRRALRDAAVAPEDVGYVEAHGTGTVLGDPMETRALADVYGQGARTTLVGSIKSSVGHLEAAAGLAGLLKSMLVVSRGIVPAQPQFTRLNPAVPFGGTSLRVPVEATAIEHGPGGPLAAVSSFGFGGTNAHVILSAPQDATPGERGVRPGADAHGLSPVTTTGPVVLALAAASEPSLRRMREAVRVLAREVGDGELLEHAAATSRAVQPFRFRAAWSGSDAATLRASILSDDGQAASPVSAGNGGQGCIFVFSGQGSSFPGMGRSLYQMDETAGLLEEWEDIVRDTAGWSLRERLESFETETDTLTAQICIGAVQLATVHVLARWGILPTAVVGHSMGEAVAAVTAGMLSVRDGFRVLVARARAIEHAGPGGAMVSTDLDVEAAEELCSRHPGLAVAAWNSARSCVLSGAVPAVDAAVAELAAAGARHRRLPVDYAFHSPLLDGADELVTAQLDDLSPSTPTVPMFSTVTGERVRGTLDATHWAANVTGRVRFAEAFAAARDLGRTRCVIEIGPRPVLTIDMESSVHPSGPAVLAAGRRGAPLHQSLAALVVDLHRAGMLVSFRDVVAAPRSFVRLPPYPWDRTTYWPDPTDGGAPSADQVPARDLPRPTDDQGTRPTPSPTRPRADTGPTVAELTAFICAGVATLVGTDGPVTVDPDRPLREWGVESLAVVNLRSQLERSFAITVPLPVLLRGDSPQVTARRLLGHPVDEAEELLARLDTMTEAEVQSLLDELDQERPVDS